MRRLSPAIITIVFAAGCGAGPTVVRYEAAPRQADLAITDAAAVRVITKDELPDGFSFDGNRLEADPGIPSVDDPHVVLGEVDVVLDRRQPRPTYLHAMQVEAAKHGANAVVVLDETGERCLTPGDELKCRLGVAVHLSSAPPAKLAEASDVLAGWLAAHGDKGKPAGAPRPIDLAAPGRITFTPKRGECTTVVLALGDDAHVARSGRGPDLVLDAVSTADHMHRENWGKDDWGLRDRALSVDAGCAQDASPVTVEVANNRGKDRAPGRGKAIVQLVRRTVDDATLAQMAKDEADEIDEADEANRRINQEACDACFDEWRACVRWDPSVQRDECPGFDRCVERRYGRPRECE